jgi:hypothetical protein
MVVFGFKPNEKAVRVIETIVTVIKTLLGRLKNYFKGEKT